jgi:hypothetical protein
MAFLERNETAVNTMSAKMLNVWAETVSSELVYKSPTHKDSQYSRYRSTAS